MGTLFRFQCPNCGYTAEVSGREDAGGHCCTQTILCEHCRALFDVVIAEFPGFKHFREHPMRCPRAKSHRVTEWNHPGPCPKCGETMTRGDEVMLWD